MSVQFGHWNFDGRPISIEERQRVDQMLAPYGPDSRSSWSSEGIWILYCGFHTTSESRREVQPYRLASGAVLVWDGRLDNRSEILRELQSTLPSDSSDVAIAGAAFERWGSACFGKLVGDWSLSLCDPRKHSILLAKDAIGLRSLYYTFNSRELVWATVLEPLVLPSGKALSLCKEYAAGWLSPYPSPRLTPYAEVRSVPPASSVDFRGQSMTVDTYWKFDRVNSAVPQNPSEYQEEFRSLFTLSIRRRLRSDAPVLAELSGGIDSSSIVCVSDLVMAHDASPAPRLDTVSYYDDSEPNWNEKPYFQKIEERRGRPGCHIDLAAERDHPFVTGMLQIAPGRCRRTGPRATTLRSWVVSYGNRVLLSGEGGDEMTGGVPTPVPELANLLVKFRLRALTKSLKSWSLEKRKPWPRLLWDATRIFLPFSSLGLPDEEHPAPWLNPDFVTRQFAALAGYPVRCRFFGALPSVQQNVQTLEALRGHLGCSLLPADPPLERRYPFLDRDLLQFLFAVPPEQLARPGCRRSLLRAALAGIVPDEILYRRRKAFVIRNPTLALTELDELLRANGGELLTARFGIIRKDRFNEAIHNASLGLDVPLVPLLRTVELELWLRSACAGRILAEPEPPAETRHPTQKTFASNWAKELPG